MLVKANNLKAGMKIELKIMASYYAKKNTLTKIVEIEEDVFYSEGDKEVMVDFRLRNKKRWSDYASSVAGVKTGSRKGLGLHPSHF